MKKRLLTTTLVGLSTVGAQAAVIYSNDFSSAQVVKSAYNGNTNYAGTGDVADMNLGEWFEGRAGTRLQLAYDGANQDMDFAFSGVGRTGWFLIDTSSLSAVNGAVNLSFQVSNYAGSTNLVTFSVWDGSGITESGRDDNLVDGYLNLKADAVTPTLNGSGVGGLAAINGGSSGLASNTFNTDGVHSVTFNMTEAGEAGDFVLVGWAADSSNATFDLDNLTLTTAAVPEPSSIALLGLGGLALILRRRK